MLFRFAHPHLLLLLLALMPIIWWHFRTRRAAEPTLPFSTMAVVRRIRRTSRQALQPLPSVIRAVALVLLVMSIARPAISRAAEDSPGHGIDIVLAVDVSYSMSATDLGSKNRLEIAKDVLREFVAGRTSDRIGLVAFASEAVSVSPLTVDYPMLLGLLDEVGFGRLPEGTGIGNGLATSVNLLRDTPGKSRVVILLTDGQNNAGDVTPEAAAQMAQLLNIRAYTIGVGAASDPPGRPTRPGQPARTSSTAIDEPTLRHISDTTGATYFRATDTTALKQIYDLIVHLEKTDTGHVKYVEVMDLSGYLLAAAASLLLLEILLQTTWLRRVP